MSRMRFMNTEIDNITMNEALVVIDEMVKKKTCGYVVTPNVDHIVRLEKDHKFQDSYKSASLILTDGKPLLWIAKWYETPIKEKISGSDLFPMVCKMSMENGYSMFFLGAAEGVAAKAAENLKLKFPGLNIVGTFSPPFGFENNEKEIDKIISRIKNVHPDILVIGLGTPKQEKFILNYYKKLNVPVSLCIGASIDFEAGNVKRAPKWMSNHGLEWFYRLLQNPKRMAKRYLIDDMKIIRLAIKYREQKR